MSSSSMNDGPHATWLPNLVGGVSIWKLASELNAPNFFDGRLLIPVTEGSESLPVTVRWDLTGLLPLHEARARSPLDVDRALTELRDALGSIAAVFATPDSGFEHYKSAFTIPALEADDGRHYLYSVAKKKVYIINWGASPRAMIGRAEHVFSYEDWATKFAPQSPLVPAAASLSRLASSSFGTVGGHREVARLARIAGEIGSSEPPVAQGPRVHGKARAWWTWPLVALLTLSVALLAVFVLKTCEAQVSTASGSSGAPLPRQASSDFPMSDGGQAETRRPIAAVHDAGPTLDVSAGISDASSDGSTADAAKESARSSAEEDDDDDGTHLGSAAVGSKVTLMAGGSAGGSDSGSGPAAKLGPFRRHIQAEAVKWRITSGNDKVARSESQAKRFDVWLAPGRTFQGVGVEWQDKSKKWHPH